MHCPNCGAPVKPDAYFCGACGHRLDHMQCPSCHAPIKPEHRFCARCGWDLEQVEPPALPEIGEEEEEEEEEEKEAGDTPSRGRGRRRWPLLILVLVAIVAVAAAAWYLPRLFQSHPQVAVATSAGTATIESAATPSVESPSPMVQPTPSLTGEEEEPLPQAQWEAALDTVAAGNTHRAIELLQELRAEYPDFEPLAVSDQLDVLCRDWYEETAQSASAEVLDALDCLEDVNPAGPAVAQRSWWEKLLAAQDHLRAGETSQAIELLEPLISSTPPDFAHGRQKSLLYEAYLQEGDMACAAEEYEAARASYIKARTLDPTRLEAGNRIASCQPPTPTPTITPTPTLTPTPLPPGAMVISYTHEGRLNLRMGPGLNYPIVERAGTGTSFTATGRTEDARWLRALSPEGNEVWLSSEVVEANYPLVAAPVVEVPPPPNEYVIADSVGDFSTTQGQNGWYYLASKLPGSLDYDWIPVEGRWYRWTKGGRSPEMRLSAEGSYPSWNSDTLRLWTSMYEGTVRIEGQAHKEAGAGRGGNGVALRIVLLRLGGEGEPDFEKQLWSDTLGAWDTAGYNFEVPPFEIQQGDEVFFIASAVGDDRQDNTVFTSHIILINEGGLVLTPTPTPEPTPTPAPPPPLCFEPRLRHYEEHRGCCGEVVGIAYTYGGRLSWGQVHIEGPPATDQYRMDFPVNKDGGYEITALNQFADYTIWLKGTRIRSGKFVVHYEDLGKVRAVVDFHQIPCQ